MNITEHEHGSMRLFAVRTGAKDVVTIEGSVLGGYLMLPKELRMVPRIATGVFDAATKKRSKDAIRNALTDRGASISFSPGGDRTYFQATCLPEDTDFVLKLIAECLRDALFPAKEITLQKQRSVAEIEEAKTETRALAAQNFMRMVFDPSHSNYSDTIEESIAKAQGISRSDVIGYQKLLGTGGLIFAITGDIIPEKMLGMAERAFSILPKGTASMSVKHANTRAPKATESRIFVADKANIDVFMGAAVPITYDDPQFIPFSVMGSMLAGRGLSGGHLMRTIRERDGFTYGIYGNPVGFGGESDGAFQIWATFSPAMYEKAVEATRKEIKTFLSSGMTEEGLAAKKGEITGKYAVGLGTSHGLASTLHTIGIEGKPLSYTEDYPSIIAGISLKEVIAASTLVPWDSLSIAAAGTFEKK